MQTILLVAVIAGLGFMILGKLEAIERRLARQQSILDQLTQDLPETPPDDEVVALIADGESIKAIKLAREIYGFSLIEAKQYVDRLKNDR